MGGGGGGRERERRRVSVCLYERREKLGFIIKKSGQNGIFRKHKREFGR